MSEDSDDPWSRDLFLEQITKRGSEEIAKMSVSERAKRAMLAEAVEDNIVSKEIQLGEILGDSGVIPSDPNLLEQCRDISMQIREAQLQYEALVTGKSSALLNTFESLGVDLNE
jgi:hypothetical protein